MASDIIDAVEIDPAVATALADLVQVDGVSTCDRVDAILRHYLTDLHGRLAPAAASVAAVVTGAAVVAEHAVEHRDGPETSGFPHLPEAPETRSGDPASVADPAPEADTPWTCCGQTFINPQGLGAHRRYRHPDGAGLARKGTRKKSAKKDRAPADPLLDVPRVPVETHPCKVCRRRVTTVRKVRGIGDCCRDCAKAAA